eukprot:CAMPEP_0204607744 /NCGR_PEP_ID=MMETSP0661-20131031/59897_1 /ASSEMBLY_ACC=CAM_ASM_000606 /TAXON_ID=109239 /ORGANISM="Alexandrium margalefi, Strain AMGDE01CS-322" /LENGTH=191 /DNA_ID=CAMNT_0051619181 /DNA_START=657 /DNA_END=1233 /DNA_ORIENTATION=-
MPEKAIPPGSYRLAKMAEQQRDGPGRNLRCKTATVGRMVVARTRRQPRKTTTAGREPSLSLSQDLSAASVSACPILSYAVGRILHLQCAVLEQGQMPVTRRPGERLRARLHMKCGTVSAGCDAASLHLHEDLSHPTRPLAIGIVSHLRGGGACTLTVLARKPIVPLIMPTGSHSPAKSNGNSAAEGEVLVV